MKTESPEQTAATMPTPTSVSSFVHPTNILVPLDFSEISLKALQYAVPFARQYGAKLTLVHVVDLPLYVESPIPTRFGPEEIAEIKKRVADTCAPRIPEELTVETVIRQGGVFETILEVARETSANLIITTTHGRTGLSHLVLGSTAEDLVRRADCPVLVIHEREREFV